MLPSMYHFIHISYIPRISCIVHRGWRSVSIGVRNALLLQLFRYCVCPVPQSLTHNLVLGQLHFCILY